MPTDADRATTLWRAADELAWRDSGPRPAGYTRLELYEITLREAHRIHAPEERAKPGLHVATELNIAGRFEQARELLESTLERYPDALQTRAYLLLQLAETDRLEGSLASAWERITQVEDAVARSGLQPDLQRLHEAQLEPRLIELRMNVLLGLGLPDQYWTWLQEYEQLMGPDDPEVLWYRARFWLATDNFTRVIETLTPLLDTIEYEPWVWTNLQLVLAMAEAELSWTEPRSLERAIELFERILSRPDAPAQAQRSAQLRLVELEIRAGDHRAARTRIDGIDRERLLDSQGPWLTALEARLAMAGGASADELARRLEDLRAASDESLASWAASSRRKGGVGILHYVMRRDIVSELIQLTLTVEGRDAGAQTAVRDLMRMRALGSVAAGLREVRAGPVTLEEFRRVVLAPGRGALVLFPGTERSHVFAIDSEGVVCAQTAPLVRWNPLRVALEERLRFPPHPETAAASAEEIERLAAELAELLIPDEIAARVGSWSELFVESAHLTGFLPFELLPLHGVPLGQSVPLAYLPSLNVGCLLKRREVAGDADAVWDVTLVADPDGPTPELDLPWTRGQADAVREAYGADRVALRLGAEASPSVLSDPELMSSKVLQLVLHGLYDPTQERPAGIAMAPGEHVSGQVWGDMIERLERVPKLVVLAVCGAARGPLRSGDDGVTSLGSAFLLARADAVLLSPYDLEFQATIALTDIFHERLRVHGETPARAMLEARRELAASERFAHPFHHSLMQVVGLGHDPLFDLVRPDPAGDGPTPPGLPPLPILAALAAVVLVAVALVILGYRARAS